MPTPKCLIIDSVHESMFSMLENIGWAYDYRPEITRDEIRAIHFGYDGLIVRSKTSIDQELLGENITLRFIGRAGAGIDNVDVNYLKRKNILIFHAAEGNRHAVGEFAVGLLLSLLRNIPRADNEVRQFVWDREGNRGEEVNGKTISLLGFGNMGRSFAQCISGFGCKILAYDKYKSAFTNHICEEASLSRIFEETDILSLHIPLTDETRAMVNLNFLNRFKKNIIVLNTARGEIIPLNDLVLAMTSGKVRGAALDVLENEKLKNLNEDQQRSMKYLMSQSNVIFTPHIAGWTYESHVKINVALVEKIKTLEI
jgi:D-3-phosphoglycerate dehydrogenase / 2-oxoglutarate reductase